MCSSWRARPAPGQSLTSLRRWRSTLPTESDFYIQDWPAPTALSEMQPDVAYNPDDDEYLVVFDRDFGGVGDRDVMSVVVYPDGGISPMPIALADDANWDDSNPAVAYNPDDRNYMVVWERRDARYEPDRGPWGIWGRFWVAVNRIHLPLVLRAAP